MVSGADSYFVFADWNIWAHAYAVRLSDGPEAPAPVVVIYDDCLVEVAPSFRALLEQYVAGDVNTIFSDPPEWRAKHGNWAV